MNIKHLACAAMGILLFSGSVVHAEWSEDKENSYWSGLVVEKFATGQLNGYRYFCIQGRKSTGVIKACASNDSNFTVWANDYEDLYKQAMDYYLNGRRMRMYAVKVDWKNPKFVTLYSSYHITGFTSCNDPDSEKNCFGD